MHCTRDGDNVCESCKPGFLLQKNWCDGESTVESMTSTVILVCTAATAMIGVLVTIKTKCYGGGGDGNDAKESLRGEQSDS